MEDRQRVEIPKIYISYSHKDAALLEELMLHLRLLERRGLVSLFYDREIRVGNEWGKELARGLAESSIVLFLVSADSLASEYVYQELTAATALHESQGLVVIPVLLRPCDWSASPLSRFQALPPDARPVSLWPDRDEAFLAITNGIRQVVESLTAAREQVEAVKGAGGLRMPEGHHSAVTAIAITPDGAYAVSGASDGTLIKWDLRTRERAQMIQEVKMPIVAIAVTPQGRFVFSGAAESVIRCDLSFATPVHYPRRNASITTVAALDEGRALWGWGDGFASVMDFERKVEPKPIAVISPVSSIATLPDKERIVFAGSNGTLTVWNVNSGRTEQSYTVSARLDKLAVSPDGHLALAVEGAIIHAVDLASGKELFRITAHVGDVVGIDVLADRRRAVSVSADRTLRIWDLETHAELGKLALGPETPTCMALTPDGLHAVCGFTDGSLTLYDVNAALAQRPLPVGYDRLQLAYLAVLDSPELFQVLETLDESVLASIVERLSGAQPAGALQFLRDKYPDAVPPPLWAAWMQTVHGAKLGVSPEPA